MNHKLNEILRGRNRVIGNTLILAFVACLALWFGWSRDHSSCGIAGEFSDELETALEENGIILYRYGLGRWIHQSEIQDIQVRWVTFSNTWSKLSNTKGKALLVTVNRKGGQTTLHTFHPASESFNKVEITF